MYLSSAHSVAWFRESPETSESVDIIDLEICGAEGEISMPARQICLPDARL